MGGGPCLPVRVTPEAELRLADMITKFDDLRPLNACLAQAQFHAKGDGGRVEGICIKNTKEFFIFRE